MLPTCFPLLPTPLPYINIQVLLTAVSAWLIPLTGSETWSEQISNKFTFNDQNHVCVYLRSTRQSGTGGLFLFFSVALRPRKRDGLLGKGTTEWRLDRGYRPKKTGETVDRRQNNGNVKAVSPRHCPATCALRNCCFICCAGQSHKDSDRCTAVGEQLWQLEAKEVQLSQPSSTSLLMISSGLNWRSSSTSLL